MRKRETGVYQYESNRGHGKKGTERKRKEVKREREDYDYEKTTMQVVSLLGTEKLRSVDPKESPSSEMSASIPPDPDPEPSDFGSTLAKADAVTRDSFLL